MEETTDERSGDLVARWRNGDQRAADELVRRYTAGLIELARRRLPAKLAHRIDPEEVVQSVYRSFFAEAREVHYDLQRGGDLWRLLVTITLNKLSNQVKRNRTGKRAAERQQNFGSEDSLLGLHAATMARVPSPVEALGLADELEQIMGRLQPLQRRILELRLQGGTLLEIAAETQRTERTVRRVLERIKQELEQGDFGGSAS